MKRLLWMSFSAAVLVLGLFCEPTESHRFVPFAWEYPYYKTQDTESQSPAPPAPPPPPPPVASRYSTDVRDPPPPKLLNSYYPASMQLLHYFSDRMQYTELHSTTVAPPYTGGDYAVPQYSGGTTPGLPGIGTQSTTPIQTTTTRPTTTTTTKTTTTPRPAVESTTQIHRPGLFAPLPPQFQMQMTEQVANRPAQPQKTTTTTRRPWQTTTSRKPWTTRSTARPTYTTTRWTTRKPPPRDMFPEYTTKRPTIPDSLTATDGFFQWFFENKPNFVKPRNGKDILYDILDPLPKDLLNDIENEGPNLPAVKDEDNAREFLKKFDDSFGRYVPSQVGNRKMPPTKPFVEFLVLYDLMKREAKVKMLGDYHGYTDNILKTLYATSFMSSERQLHYVLSQVSQSTEVESAGIKARIATIIKDLENPHSVTSQTLRMIPSLKFEL